MQTKENHESSKSRDVQLRGVKMKRKPMFDEAGTTLLNGVKINFERGFGFNQNPYIKSNAHCIDDNRIIYILASQIVLYDMLAQTQKVIDNFDYDDEVGAMLYFKNILLEDNIIYALHNNNKSFPSLSILNFSKNFHQQVMLANLQKQQKIMEICLLNDFKNIATISKVDGNTRLTIIQASSKQIIVSETINFCPIGMLSLAQFPTKLVMNTNSDIICLNIEDGVQVNQLSVRKWFQLQNQNIIQISISPHFDFCIYAITDYGNLYFIYIDMKTLKITKVERYFLGNYHTVDETGNQLVKRRKPTCFCVNQYNIAIGYQYVQQFTLVKICAVTTQPSIQSVKFSCPYLHKIVSMSFAAQTMSLCVIVQVKQNDKYDLQIPIQSQFLKGDQKSIKQNLSNHLLPAGKIFPIIFNLLLYDSLVQTLRSPIQIILNSTLLIKKILDICILSTKKLILVLSGDKKIIAVRSEHLSSSSFNKMIAWQMIFNNNDQPNCFDVHPLTFNMAVSFKDGIKFFNIYSDGMKTTNINFPIKNCECVKYSKFGHLLMLGTPSQIILINPYQNIIKHTIQLMHGFNTKQITFIDRDMYLFGLFNNGCSQIMNLDGVKIFQIWNKNTKCLYSCYDPIFDIVVISYEDNQVKFFREKGEVQFAIMWTYPFLITKMLIVNELGTLFMGTSTGKIRAYQWPITDMLKFSKSFTEIQLHRSPVTQIKTTYDFYYLVTGAEDGTVFISKIVPFSDGMMVSDSSVLHTFKINKKNYTSLYYLQYVTCTNNGLELQKEEEIAQYESDKVDTQCQYTNILQNHQLQNEKMYKQYQQTNRKALKKQISPLQTEVQQINRNKIELKDELNQLLVNWNKQIQSQQDKKINKMRQLYRESDHLKLKYQFYFRQFEDQTKQQQQKNAKQLQKYRLEMENKEQRLISDCSELEKQFYESLLNYQQLIKQQDEEGTIYIKKMMEQLETQLLGVQERGQELRRSINKQYHENKAQEQKTKYLQQMISEISIQIQSSQAKRQSLLHKLSDLGEILKQKDQQIFYEQKTVKELLKKCINNYSHEQYLKHRQNELIEKCKYLQKQIEGLDQKHKEFQDSFINVSKETNDYISKIQNAYKIIYGLKEKQKSLKQKISVRKYKNQQIYSSILQCFHETASKSLFALKIKQILNNSNEIDEKQKQERIQINIDKRDRLINQVINTNKLRKISDTNRKTLMIKLNRQTANLINEVNQLRKQKKCLTIKIRDLLHFIKQLEEFFYLNKEQNKDKQNSQSLTDIVPINISVIQSQPSKHIKSLPFQVYQQNKLTQRNSIYSKINSKSIVQQSSTQLPSIIKQNPSQAASFIQQNILQGVKENQDQVAQ